MKIGVPKEIKPQEARVGLTPAGAQALIRAGHQVNIQKGAGLLSGFSDQEFKNVGCTFSMTIQEVYEAAEMIIKVKEPIAAEYELIQPNQLLFTYFHFASSETLTQAMIETNAVCLASLAYPHV
jgi:alanine dehydrogenase